MIMPVLATPVSSLEKMSKRLRSISITPSVKEAVWEDFYLTFVAIGLSKELAQVVTSRILMEFSMVANLVAMETELFEFVSRIDVDGRALLEVLREKLACRARDVAGQVYPYLAHVKGRVVDFGAGDGQVTQELWATCAFDSIIGYDVRGYKASGIDVPIVEFDGIRTPEEDASFDAALMTNVAHHEEENERILFELARIVRPGGTAVVIETVPEDGSDEARLRTFANDYLYNRIFHRDDIPVPGTYETAEGWIDRFAHAGFELVRGFGLPSRVDLGYDQPVIRDLHVLYHFRRI